MAAEKKKTNWKKIRAEYAQGGTSFGKLAEKYGIPRSTIADRAKREDWATLRQDVSDETRTKTVQKISDRESDFLAEMSDMHAKAAKAIIQKVLGSVENYPDGVGTKTVRETVDVKEVTMDDGSVRKFPLRSSFTSDLESATRVIATLGKMYGLDAGSTLDRQRYELQREHAKASQGERERQPENNLVEMLRESMRSVTEDAIPEIKPAPEPDGDVVDEG